VRRERRKRWLRLVTAALALSVPIVLAAHPLASAASDVWGNVGPASPLGPAGLFGRYPLGHYSLDQHFDAVSASLTGGVDVSGVPAMIAYFLASVLWALTSFLANLLISLFAFAFGLDLVNGSAATGGAGALGPVAQAIHSLYANVFGAPWLALAVAIAGVWAMWRALVQRRYAETAGALGLSLIYVVVALFFVAEPGKTIGAASEWTNRMSVAFLAVADHGNPSAGAQAREGGADQLLELLVAKPWAVLEFGGLEHCAKAGTGSEDADPESVAVRPLAPGPARDAELARRLEAGTEVQATGKVCVNNANKYGSHFLRFAMGSDERDAEYDALDHGDSSRLPEADPERGGYRLGVADKPATDAMEAGGQYQRLLVAIVVLVGELGAFCLLGALSVGVILAQVLLLLLLAFAPVALVAAAIPGRGHAFFRGWLEKLVGYLLRKAAYSLMLAVLLAVASALADATSALGWLMSFGLQALFFWAVFLQRRTLAESLVGIATGPGTPGREGTLRVLGLYYGARTLTRPLRRARRTSREAPRRSSGGGGSGGSGGRPGGSTSPAPRPDGDRGGLAGGGAPVRTPTRPRADGPAGRTRPDERGQREPRRDSGERTADAREPAAKETGQAAGPGRGPSPQESPPRPGGPKPVEDAGTPKGPRPASSAGRRVRDASAEPKPEPGAEPKAERGSDRLAPREHTGEERPQQPARPARRRRRRRRRKGRKK
jgi:hypothetical protein